MMVSSLAELIRAHLASRSIHLDNKEIYDLAEFLSDVVDNEFADPQRTQVIPAALLDHLRAAVMVPA